MAKEVVMRRGDVEIKEEGRNGQAQLAPQQAQLDARQAHLAAKIESLNTKRAQVELAGPQNFWDILAQGPFQGVGLEPSRVIEVGEQATIRTWVYLNPFYPLPYPGQNARDIITGFDARIELNYITSNMQTMQPVPELSYSVCFKTNPGQSWYYHDWVFTPQRSACIYETNICCRICNCSNRYIQQYSGFARWIQDLDYETIWGTPPGWRFDHPVRFMVSDSSVLCEGCPTP